jgi:Fe2+ or Zn2+ uptake regulation protein
MRDRLLRAGLRVTRPRLEVFRFLAGQERPRSHAEVTRALQERGTDRATIFRVLVSFVEAGVARRLDFGDRTWRFELRGAPHPHLVCTACGSVECLVGAKVNVRGLPIRNQELLVQLHGRCSSCAMATR